MTSSTSQNSPLQLPWAILGAGRIGTMMALWAGPHHFDVGLLWNHSKAGGDRTREALPGAAVFDGEWTEGMKRTLSGQPHWVWLTTQDRQVEPTARMLASVIHPDSVVCHMAGSLSSKVLKDAGVQARCGSVHPLLAVSDSRQGLANMGRAAWTVEGDVSQEAVEMLRRGGIEAVVLEAKGRALYHAAAVTSAGLVTSVIDASWQMAQAAGLTQEQARAMLLPLAQSCIDNLWKASPREALTGPVARGDVDTIKRHEQGLMALDSGQELLTLYRVLNRHAERLLQAPSEPAGGVRNQGSPDPPES